MKRMKTALSLVIVSSLLLSFSVSFAGTQKLSLEDAITLSKENSATIRSITNKEFSTQNTIRENVQKSYQLERALDTYYDYIELYNTVIDEDNERSSAHPYYRYVGKSDDDLIKIIGSSDPTAPTDPTKARGLVQDLMIATWMGQTDEVNEINKEIEFIQYYIYFGDDPKLTKESKYEKFKKNEAMLQNSVELIETKYEQGLNAAIKGTEAGVIKLYVGLKDLDQGLKIKKDMLNTYEDGLANMKISYDKGLVSKITYENQVKTVEMKRLEVENMQYQFDNLRYQLKKMCNLDMEDDVILSTIFDNQEYELKSPDLLLSEAYENNMNYANLSAELNYNEKNFEVMNKYLDDYDKNSDSIKPIYYQEKVDQQDTIDDLKDQLKNQQQLIEANVYLAYNDLLLKKKLVDHNKDTLELAENSLNSSIQSFKLGQITQLDLDQVKLQYAGALMTADQNIRSYNKSVENFKLLINYGVAYSTDN